MGAEPQGAIKLIAPRFPKRVLHNVRYLGDVYGMPIEAIEARLFEDSKGQGQLSVARLLLAEFYSLTPNGQDLRAELETRGLW